MVDVLETKRAAMRFRILVEIAERQPAVRQGEIAEAMDVTSQAVSDYIRELVEDGYVEREGRSRYSVTKEGVDWLLQSAADVRRYADHVTDDVLGGLQEDAAIAATTISKGDEVGLRVDDGLLTADPNATAGATGRASNDADEGGVVGVTSFEGVMELEAGNVTVYQIPSIRTGSSGDAVDPERFTNLDRDVDMLLCAGVEAVVAARYAQLHPDTWFAPGAVAAEAAGRGLDVAVIATMDYVGRVTDAVRDAGMSYEVVDATT